MRIMLPKKNQQLKILRLLFFETMSQKAITLKKRTIPSQITKHLAHEQVDRLVLKRDLRSGQVASGSG